MVLVEPEIHWNTGNVGRTCLGTGAHLHLIEPLGFSLDDRHLKRAGLDYWHKVKLRVWGDFQEFISAMRPKGDEVALFSKSGARSIWSMPQMARAFLIFGAETKGLPAEILNRYAQSIFSIPINREIRSLNLSTAVGIALYETLRPAVGECSV